MSISSGGSSEATCKIVPQAVVFKIRGSDKSYEEALEASAKFNKRLCRERKMRIPFIDNQTRVAQTNSMFWLGEYQRSKSNKPGNVYTYPSKKWYKHRRLEFDSNDLNYLFPRHHFQSMSQPLENGMNGGGGSGSYYSNLNGNLLNENSNSMDSFHYNTSSTSHNGLQGPSQMLKQTSSNSNEDYGIGNSNDEWSHNHNHNHNQQQSSHHLLMHEDSFENFDANNDDDSGGDPEDYDDPSFKKKKGKKTKTGRKKLSELGPDDKPFSCKECGVKYKTRPGLNYHVQKAHNNGSQSSTSHAKGNKHHIQNEAVINPDENTTNSVFDSAYDDMNSSSSLPQIANNNHQAISFSSNQHAASLSNNTQNNHNITNSFNNNNNNNSKNSLNRCGICGTNTDAYDGSGKPSSTQTDKFVACSECLKSFHSSCLKFNANMVQSVKKYNWQCVDCKKCVICGNSENDDKLLFCDDCDRGYHMYCLKPPMSEAPAGDWRCELCVKHLGNQ